MQIITLLLPILIPMIQRCLENGRSSGERVARIIKRRGPVCKHFLREAAEEHRSEMAASATTELMSGEDMAAAAAKELAAVSDDAIDAFVEDCAA